MGKYEVTSPRPFTLGSQCAGVVEQVGEGVTHLAVGDNLTDSSFGGNSTLKTDLPLVETASLMGVDAFEGKTTGRIVMRVGM